MLVLSRKVGERIVINGEIEVVVVSMEGNKCQLGVVAPMVVPVHRQEVYEKIKAQEDDPATLTFTGATTGSNPLAIELEAAKAGLNGRNLVLDFTNVRRVNSLELGTLVEFHKRLKLLGACLTLIGMDLNLRGIFAANQLDSVLTITSGP
jgi:carbon storage regulator